MPWANVNGSRTVSVSLSIWAPPPFFRRLNTGPSCARPSPGLRYALDGASVSDLFFCVFSRVCQSFFLCMSCHPELCPLSAHISAHVQSPLPEPIHCYYQEPLNFLCLFNCQPLSGRIGSLEPAGRGASSVALLLPPRTAHNGAVVTADRMQYGTAGCSYKAGNIEYISLVYSTPIWDADELFRKL